jgi:hypothetical protein
MKFDTVRFLTDYNIPYWGQGENVSRGHVGVTCPFCEDTYNHLGLSLTGKKVPNCWKCGRHSWFKYIRTVTGEDPKAVIEKYSDVYSVIEEDYKPVVHAVKCVPPGTKDFKPGHLKYLESRGFDPEYLILKYDLTVTGATDRYYPFRIIFPIKYNGRVVSYQGRSYTGAEPKYKTCFPEQEVMFHKDIFFNLDNSKGDTVIIVEGVFDAIRLGDNAIASFGTAILPAQLNLVASRYSRAFVLYDTEYEAQKKARAAAYTLNSGGIKTELIKLDSGDPGEMSSDDALYLKRDLGVL